jgi:L-malate glycosyltransferase
MMPRDTYSTEDGNARRLPTMSSACESFAGQTPPMRVLHVISGDLWAGAEVQVYQILRAARREPSVELHVVVLNPGMLADRLVAAGIIVTVLDESQLGMRALAREIRVLARAWRPAVVHTHRRKEHFLGALAARACGAGLVATVHGRSELPHRGIGLRQQLLRVAERTLLARVYRRLVAVSDELAQYLPGAEQRKVVIPNSVDVIAVRNAAMAEPMPTMHEGAIRIGFLGRLVPVKQIHHMLDMMHLLEAAQPGRWVLHVVGDGPLREELQRRAADPGLERAVTFHGFLPNPLPLLAQMDLLLFASAHEGLPMTALEALTLGVPIVSPPIGSLERLLDEAGAGAVAQSAQPRDLADAVMSLRLGARPGSGLRPALLPERYRIENGVRCTVSLWQEIARVSPA